MPSTQTTANISATLLHPITTLDHVRVQWHVLSSKTLPPPNNIQRLLADPPAAIKK